MSRVTMTGGDARRFDPGDAIVMTSLWPSPRALRLWKWIRRGALTTTTPARPPSFREAWRGFIEERAIVKDVDPSWLEVR